MRRQGAGQQPRVPEDLERLLAAHPAGLRRALLEAVVQLEQEVPQLGYLNGSWTRSYRRSYRQEANRTIVGSIVIFCCNRTAVETVVSTAVAMAIGTAFEKRLHLCPKSSRIVRIEDGFENPKSGLYPAIGASLLRLVAESCREGLPHAPAGPPTADRCTPPSPRCLGSLLMVQETSPSVIGTTKWPIGDRDRTRINLDLESGSGWSVAAVWTTAAV